VVGLREALAEQISHPLAALGDSKWHDAWDDSAKSLRSWDGAIG